MNRSYKTIGLLRQELERTRDKQDVERQALEEERKGVELLRKGLETSLSLTEEAQRRLCEARSLLDTERDELEAMRKELEIDRAQLDQARQQFDEEKKNAEHWVENPTNKMKPEEGETENKPVPTVEDSQEHCHGNTAEDQAHNEENPPSPDEVERQIDQSEGDTREQQPPVGADPKEEPQRVDPEKRGGRPRDYEKHPPNDLVLRNRKGLPRIGVVCKKWNWQWHIGLELPEDLEDIDTVHVRQGNMVVERAAFSSDLWVLTESDYPAVIQWVDEGVEKRVEAIVDKSNLVFKLEGNQEKGRLVKSVSSGSHAVFVPQTWQRDESESGLPAVQPENAAWPGYKVHFFDFQSGERPRIVFRSGEGLHQTISEALQVELIGNLLPDANENVGALFGGLPPVLSVQALSQIKTILLGEEGPERGGWRSAFHWDAKSYQQQLPAELATRGSHWYFLRFYDTSDDLIGTLDFRFVPGLRSILTQRAVDEVGNSSAIIEFAHDSNCTVALKDPLPSTVYLNTSEGRTVATVQSDSCAEDTSWLIKQEPGTQIMVKVDSSFLRWSLGDEVTPANEWETRPILLSREQFKPTSSSCLWIRFPTGAASSQTLLGFSKWKARQYRMNLRKKILMIHLRDYSDSDEVQGENSAQFQLWLHLPDGSLDGQQVVVGTIPRRITAYHCIINGCGFSTNHEPELYQHVSAQHDKYNYLDLVDDYDEFLNHYKDVVGTDWPKRIYRCRHCDGYVRADDSFSNPIDAIYRHQVDEHLGKQHGFTIVKSVDEIRHEVITSLPKLYRCKHGDAYIEDRDVQDAWHHFLTVHRDEFVCIKVTEDIPQIT